jgi:branched-chain amino acid aminotransferase
MAKEDTPVIQAFPTAYMRDGLAPFEQSNVSIASAPFLYGLTIYSVFPVFWNEEEQRLYAFRLNDHFKRLQNSSKIMAFDQFLTDWDYARFEKAMKELLAENKIKQDALVRVSVFVDDLLKGTRMHQLKHSLCAFIYPASQFFGKDHISLGVSSWTRTPDNSIPSRAKINGSYVNASLMKHEAVLNGFDDAIALDVNGHVAESTVANLFLVKEGQLFTPSSTTDLLEGITRDTVFKLAEKLGIPCVQRVVDRSELYYADEIFLCGSSANITPVTSVDHRPVGAGRPGDITKRLAAKYMYSGRGNQPLFPEWITKI